MEKFVIQVPDNKSSLVQQLLRELGVTIIPEADHKKPNRSQPNALTTKTIDDARKGIGICEPIKDIHIFMNSI